MYLIALLPVLAGGALWVLHHKIVWWEWAISASSGFALAGIMHLAAVEGMTHDKETWSGEVVSVLFRPEWIERYTVTHTAYNTDSNGNTTTTTYTTTHYDKHPDRWYAYTSLGQSLSISLQTYQSIGKLFGGESLKEKGRRSTSRDNSTMVSGDPYDHVVYNKTGHIEPVVKSVSFDNRVKASPSVFSYAELSPEESSMLPEYPEADNPWVSGRVINAPISIRRWDQMMARLGPAKKVNVILVRLKSAGHAQLLEAKWVGGKKNDLVLCYGDGWSYVFGWTEKEMAKRELETILLTREVDDSIIPHIEKAVLEHYELVDWSKFDYLDLEPRPVHFVLMLVFVCLLQICLYTYFHSNEHAK